MKKTFIFILLALSSLHLIFSIRTNLFFSQDDFAVLAYFKSHSAIAMIKEFLLFGDPWGFHKILGYLDLRLLFDLFGVWPLPYLLNNQLLHTGSLILLFLLIRQLSQSNFKAFFFSVIFNSLYLSYFSNVHEYLVTFLCLLSAYLFLKSHHRLSLILFFTSLLAKEVALTLPFLLLALTFFQGKSIKPLFPFFSLALWYFAYQLAFFVTKTPLGPDHPYATSVKPSTIWLNLRYYLSTPWLMVIGASLPFSLRRRSFPLILVAFMALLPALILKNRQESYYLYLPLAFLAVYLALTFPVFKVKTSVVFLATFLLLGGRRLLPPIARQDFTNWQKHSLEQVVSLVESQLTDRPASVRIKIKPDGLERDALLMLQTDTIDLFLRRSLSQNYRLTFLSESGVLVAYTRN